MRRAIERDVRSIAHLKMLQSLSGKLNRLNDVREIGDEIAAELRSLIDYHNCRVFVVDGDELIPVAFLGESHRRDVGLRSLEHPPDNGRRRHHRPLRRARRVDRRRRRRELRVRAADRGHARSRSRCSRCRFATARRVVGVIVVSKLGLEPVRRGRRAAARGARRPCGGRGREREPLRVGAARGRERDVAARVRPRARDARRPRRHRRAGHRALRGDPRQPQHVLLPRDGRRARRCRREHGHSPEIAAKLAARPLPRRGASTSTATRTSPRPRTTSRRSDGWRPSRAAATRSRRSTSTAAAGCLVALVEQEDFGERELRAARRPRAAGEARDRECLELRGARADVRLHRRGARERARGERRVHVHPRALDHRSLPAGRPRARPRRAHAEAPRARRAAPRHRQDRHPERHALEAGPADRRRAAARRDASGARRADHRADRPAPGRAADRPPLPRALGRRAATPTASPARTSRSSRGSSSSATRTTR